MLCAAKTIARSVGRSTNTSQDEPQQNDCAAEARGGGPNPNMIYQTKSQKGHENLIAYSKPIFAPKRGRPGGRCPLGASIRETIKTTHNTRIRNCTYEKQKHRQNTNINPNKSHADYFMVYPNLKKGPFHIWNANLYMRSCVY